MELLVVLCYDFDLVYLAILIHTDITYREHENSFAD